MCEMHSNLEMIRRKRHKIEFYSCKLNVGDHNPDTKSTVFRKKTLTKCEKRRRAKVWFISFLFLFLIIGLSLGVVALNDDSNRKINDKFKHRKDKPQSLFLE
mmetsp:Transcript_32209/g.49257  ORF Transcript_32209/g.49257 Transcript_32209/m.49257 type:complete len:102 (-) Transcript_32209:4-309(-)